MTTLPNRRPLSIDVSAAIARCGNTCERRRLERRGEAAPSATFTARCRRARAAARRARRTPRSSRARGARARRRCRRPRGRPRRRARGQLRQHLAGVAVAHPHLRPARERQVLAHEVDEVGLELDDLLARPRSGRDHVPGQRERAAAEVHRRDRLALAGARGRSRGRCGARTRSRATRVGRARRATAACRRRTASTIRARAATPRGGRGAAHGEAAFEVWHGCHATRRRRPGRAGQQRPTARCRAAAR